MLIQNTGIICCHESRDSTNSLAQSRRPTLAAVTNPELRPYKNRNQRKRRTLLILLLVAFSTTEENEITDEQNNFLLFDAVGPTEQEKAQLMMTLCFNIMIQNVLSPNLCISLLYQLQASNILVNSTYLRYCLRAFFFLYSILPILLLDLVLFRY